jgi:hypothetical protein
VVALDNAYKFMRAALTPATYPSKVHSFAIQGQFSVQEGEVFIYFCGHICIDVCTSFWADPL